MTATAAENVQLRNMATIAANLVILVQKKNVEIQTVSAPSGVFRVINQMTATVAKHVILELTERTVRSSAQGTVSTAIKSVIRQMEHA